MRPVLIAVVIVVAIIGIFFGLLAYSYTQIHVTLNDVNFNSIDWAPLSWSTLVKLGLNTLIGNWLGAAFDLIDGINLDLVFGFSNNGVLPVYIPDLSYDLSMNGVPMGKGYTNVEVTIYPGQTKEITALQNFNKNSLLPAVSSIVSNNGVLDIHAKGTAYFKLLGISIPIPFESTKSVSVYNEIKKHISEEIQKNQQQQVSSITNPLSNAINSIVKKITGADTQLNLQLSGQPIVDSVYKIRPGS